MWHEILDLGGTFSGADVNAVAQRDFDNDGDIDIITISEEISMTAVGDTVDVKYLPSSVITVLQNGGDQSFSAITVDNFDPNLGGLYYNLINTLDINNDGLTDLLAHYWDKSNNEEWFTTIFINEGNLQFQKYDSDLFTGNYQESGLVMPTGRYENAGAEVMIIKMSEGGFSTEPIIESYISSIQISEDLSYIEFS